MNTSAQATTAPSRFPGRTLPDANVLIDTATRLGEAWVDANAEANILEETKKTVLARTIARKMAGHTSGALGERPKPLSAAQAEQQALGDPEYEFHLQLMVDRRKDADRARVRYDMSKLKVEVWRTESATNRQEMHMSGSRGN